jgi:hypothetical protein
MTFISISADAGQVQTLLGSLLTHKIALQAANAAGKQYQKEVKAFIRSGKAYNPKPEGKGEKSIKWKPIGDGAMVYTKARHLLWIEEGTGSKRIGFAWSTYPIKNKKSSGKKALTLAIGGGILLRSSVNHPGMLPKPFFFSELEARQDAMLGSVMLTIKQAMQKGGAKNAL